MTVIHELSAALPGRLQDSPLIRGIHATDASHYQHIPTAVATPLNEEEVQAAVQIAARHRLPITARGAATSLSGQTQGTGLILDLSRHLNRMTELNPKEGWARVQPGVTRDQLNEAAAEHGLFFAPDPSTSSRATLGGMVGNNASGMRSIRYGRTDDHLLGCRLVLANGETVALSPKRRPDWASSPEAPLLEGLRNIVDAYRPDIARQFPKVMRRVSGYALDAFLEDPNKSPWDLCKLLCGSEGSLGILTELTVKLVPLPTATSLVLIHFDDLAECLQSVEPLISHDPSAVELMDGTVCQAAQTNPSTREIAGMIEGAPAALLMVELTGSNPDEAASKAENMVAELKKTQTGAAWQILTDTASQTQAWEVRRLGLGLITNRQGATKGQAFIEDACLPLPTLAAYVQDVRSICKKEDVNCIFYGHASVGVLHARPELDLHKQADVAKMRRIAEAAFLKCKSYGGAWSGEHGDGQVRGEFMAQFYGPRVLQAFRDVKKLFDPEGILNPGKGIDTPPMDQDLRYQPPGYSEHSADADAHSWFHYRSQGGFTLAVEQCNGVGACRKLNTGIMCPSYRATREEKDSTRARANALRLAISGQLPEAESRSALASDAIQDILKLCLGCKACSKECPNSVDMTKMKAEALQARHDVHGIPLGTRLIGSLPILASHLAGPLAPLINGLSRQKSFRYFLQQTTGIDARRNLPPLANRSLKSLLGDTRVVGSPVRGSVALFVDATTNAYEPHIGLAALEVLSTCGYQVQPLFVGDSQRARISKGLLAQAKRDGEKLFRKIDRAIDPTTPILCLEPSCASSLKEDLPDLLDNRALADRVSHHVWMLEAFLHREGVPLQSRTPKLTIHGHCHQKSVFGMEELKDLLPNATMIEAGCCGMAGSFGYEHPDLSLAIGEDRLFPAIRQQDPDTTIIANGFSCRHQIADACGIMPKHIVEILHPA